MDKDTGISLQINLSPTDYELCRNLLPFQIRMFYEQVDEVVLTVESKKSKGKRFGVGFEENKEKLDAFLESLLPQYPKLRLVPVDYSKEAKQAVSRLFFSNTSSIPDKDFRGGPFYCYFYGLFSCTYSHVLHLDCDMIIGGNPKHWLDGATRLLKKSSVAFVLPISGPPTTDFNIYQSYTSRINRYTYSFDRFTTRIFLTDIQKLIRHKITLRLMKPTLKRCRHALMQRNFWEMPELLIADMMKKHSMYRLDYWGENDTEGCYSLHPVHKPASFINAVPAILALVSENRIPDDQKGHYDFNNKLFLQA